MTELRTDFIMVLIRRYGSEWVLTNEVCIGIPINEGTDHVGSWSQYFPQPCVDWSGDEP